MATIKIDVEVTANGMTPFTASELAEVTSYLQNVLGHNGIKGSIPDIDFRMVGTGDAAVLKYHGEGSFL